MIKTLWLLLLCGIYDGVYAQNSEIDQLDKKLDQVEDTARVNLLVRLAGEFANNDLDRADSLTQEALDLSEQLGYQEGLVKAYNMIAHIRSSKGEYEEGHQYVNKAIELSEKLGTRELIAQSYNYLFVILFKKGDYKQALPAAEKSLEIAEEINSIRLMAQGNDNIGVINGINGRHTEAIEYFLESFRLFEELGDESQMARALLHLGHTFELAGSYEKALEYLKRALKVHQRTGNKYNEAWALVNIGVTYSRLNQVDTALSYYERSLELAEEIKDQRLILTNLDNIGGKYSLMKEFDKANAYLHKAFQISEGSGVNSRTVYITGNLAENYLYMGKYDSARYYGEKQLELALYSGLISEQKVAYYVLAQVYDSLNDYQKATEALQHYITVSDTIFSREKSQQIEDLRESYETEQKEQEIASLEKEKKAEQFRRNTLAGVALLFLLIGGLLYNNQRLKARKNKELLTKEKEVDDLKSKFFANITHEFRTPLTLILGPIEMMKSEAVNPQVLRHLSVMKTNASRLLDLINQLLELSKIEAGSLKLKATQKNVVPVVKGVIMSFESMAQQNGIVLKVESTKEEINLYFDQEKLEKALINLISNALKFTRKGGMVSVKVSDFDQHLNIQIIDSGIGIPEKDLGFIFDRFYQSSRSNGNNGSGIGLALSKELVELHHGSIRVESKEGVGTQFFIDIPMGDDHLSEEEMINDVIFQSKRHFINGWDLHETPTGETVSGSNENTESSTLQLLLIEDNADVRNYVTEILNNDYQIIQAPDGEEGIKMALEYIPDVIISDVMMPEKDGYEVCYTLKKDEKTSHVPIILLTAKVSTEDKIMGLEKEADDYLIKPFEPKELLVRVRNLIESRKKLRERFQRELILKPSEMAVNSIDEQFITRLLKIVEEHLGNEKFGVEQLAEEIGMSRSQIHRKMVALTNQAPNQFIRTFRLTRAMELLKKKAATTSEIAYQVGFSSPSYFTKCFRETFGYPPLEIPG